MHKAGLGRKIKSRILPPKRGTLFEIGNLVTPFEVMQPSGAVASVALC